MPGWLYQSLTSDILAAYYAVFRALKQRDAYSEANFTEALRVELQQRGHAVRQQVKVWRTYRGRRIGHKKARLLKDEHAEQLLIYLIDSRLAVGLLLNFGGDHPELRRIENHAAPAYQPSATLQGG